MFFLFLSGIDSVLHLMSVFVVHCAPFVAVFFRNCCRLVPENVVFGKEGRRTAEAAWGAGVYFERYRPKI